MHSGVLQVSTFTLIPNCMGSYHGQILIENETDSFTWQIGNNEMDRFLFIVQPANKEIALAVCKYLKSYFEPRKQKMSHQT